PPNAIPLGDLRRVVHIELDDLQVTGVLLAHPLDERRDDAAWSAPGGPEVDQYRHRRVELLIERIRPGLDDPRQVGVTHAAAWDAAVSWTHSVLRGAVGAGDDRAGVGHRFSLGRGLYARPNARAR